MSWHEFIHYIARNLVDCSRKHKRKYYEIYLERLESYYSEKLADASTVRTFWCICVKFKVICNYTILVKVKVTIEQATKPNRGSRGIAVLFLHPWRWMGGGGNTTPRQLYPRQRPGPHCIGSWVGPRVCLDRCEKSRLHRDSICGPSKP